METGAASNSSDKRGVESVDRDETTIKGVSVSQNRRACAGLAIIPIILGKSLRFSKSAQANQVRMRKLIPPENRAKLHRARLADFASRDCVAGWGRKL